MSPRRVPVSGASIAATATSETSAIVNGMWVMGADPAPDLAHAFRRYPLAGVADRMAAPALVLDAENDQFLKGEPARAQTD
jgi:hypothetical protein